MRVLVINFKRKVRMVVLLLLLAAALAVALMDTPGIAQVFNQQKELPIYYVDRQDKKVSITFDCAWGAGDIADILNTLEKEEIRATFFIVGQWADKFPDAVKMIAEKGHDIANHSNTHIRMGAADKSRIFNEIRDCGQKLEVMSGQKVNLFRPPYGDYNDVAIRTARELGYHTIQWDVDSLDWKPGISRQEILSRITKKVTSGSIILFHNDTPHTAKLLPTIIAELKKQGYGFEPVSKLIYTDHYYMDVDGKQKRKE